MGVGAGGGGGAYKQGCLKSSGTLPKFSFHHFIFLQIGLTVEINLTAKKLFKIAIRKTSRTAGLAVCKKWVGPHPFFKGKALGTRLLMSLLN